MKAGYARVSTKDQTVDLQAGMESLCTKMPPESSISIRVERGW